MNQAKPIRWGIIGCGDVTEVKSGPGLQKADGSQLVAVMRRDAEKARDYAKRHNVPRAYGDAQELIDDPEVDAVYVATPPGSHAEYAIRVHLPRAIQQQGLFESRRGSTSPQE